MRKLRVSPVCVSHSLSPCVCVHTLASVVVVPVVVQSHDAFLLLQEVMVLLSLQVEPPDTDVLREQQQRPRT